MKKLWKTLAVMLTLSLMCCLGAVTVHAETYTGSIKGGYQWNLDTSTGLLTISGGSASLIYEPERDPVWPPYAESIRTIHYESTELLGS